MSGDQRYQPQDECPLFSEALEEHIVAYTRGQIPNRGTFCGNCYTPLSRESARCPHCGADTSQRPPVDHIPEEVVKMLREQRGTENRIVKTFAYLGLFIAIVLALAVVLIVPYLRPNSGHLITATIVFALILVVGGWVLAAALGGYYGDKLAYDRARTRLRAEWADWIREREVQTSA